MIKQSINNFFVNLITSCHNQVQKTTNNNLHDKKEDSDLFKEAQKTEETLNNITNPKAQKNTVKNFFENVFDSNEENVKTFFKNKDPQTQFPRLFELLKENHIQFET